MGAYLLLLAETYVFYGCSWGNSDQIILCLLLFYGSYVLLGND